MVPMAPSSTCTRPSPIRSRSVGMSAVVIQVGSQPALDVLDIHSLAPSIILDLIALDLPDPKVLGLRTPEVVAADGSGREHGKALRQADAGLGLGIQEIEQQPLLGVIGTGGIARRRANSLIALLDQPLVIQ